MPQTRKVKLRCFCLKTFSGNQKLDDIVVSKGLSQHLNSVPQCRKLCGTIRYHNKSMNLIQFLVNSSENLNRKRKAPHQYTFFECSIDDLGLTGTSNGPIPSGLSNKVTGYKPSNQINHSELNNQTLFVGNLPRLSRDSIHELLTKEGNPITEDHEPSRNSDSYSVASTNKQTRTIYTSNDTGWDEEDGSVYYLPPEDELQTTPIMNGHQL